jgi:DNA-directed RNA polymerase specialized sigma24 family protein
MSLSSRSSKILNNSPPSKEKWALTKEAFDRLLAWLAPDREEAGRKYEEIRSNLIKGFTRHGCRTPEDLADETINRVARKLPDIEATYVGDPAPYFYAVAYNIYRESLRRPEVVSLPQLELPSQAPRPDELVDGLDPVLACLRRCIRYLNQRDQEVIVQYYRGEKQVKIRLRQQLALRHGVSLPALRLIAQRARKRLKKLIRLCLEKALPKDIEAGLKAVASDTGYEGESLIG